MNFIHAHKKLTAALLLLISAVALAAAPGNPIDRIRRGAGSVVVSSAGLVTVTSPLALALPSRAGAPGTPVAGYLYRDSSNSNRMTYCFNGTTCGAAFVAGLDQVNLTSNVTGVLPVANGGTGASSGTVSFTIASGTSALGTSAISSAACASVVTTAATGTATTDVVWWSFNGDPTGVTGSTPVTTGALTIFAYPSANNVNFKVCNLTGSSVTPGAITLNWRIVR
jgi:hypothetical protein